MEFSLLIIIIKQIIRNIKNSNYNDLIYYLSSPNNQLLLNIIIIIIKIDYLSKIEVKIF